MSNSVIDGIIPAAGLASRMRGIPKFLLPTGTENKTLIEFHVDELLKKCEIVWVPTRPENIMLFESLGVLSERVVLLPMKTESMTETLIRVSRISRADRFMMVMPDTYFAGEQPYEFLSKTEAEVQMACWPIRKSQIGKLGQVLLEKFPEGKVLESLDKDPNCSFLHSWGALAFDRSVLSFASEDMKTIGEIFPILIRNSHKVLGKVMNGKYFDCGTPEEFIEMLSISE